MAENNVHVINEELNRQVARLVELERKNYSGGDPPGGRMEARVAKLEASVGHIEKDISEIKTDLRDIRRDVREDFRIVWGGLIVLGLGLAGLMARGFHWL